MINTDVVHVIDDDDDDASWIIAGAQASSDDGDIVIIRNVTRDGIVMAMTKDGTYCVIAPINKFLTRFHQSCEEDEKTTI